ncbi:hypothetical protein [Paenibacillus sp.]|uniref:hypothetical protein n=1 Tax=Paenibacillus sp. TaxID=58172 RepID=UPI00283AB228|nr:hypothetical protein [Paenibacillus sp.]
MRKAEQTRNKHEKTPNKHQLVESSDFGVGAVRQGNSQVRGWDYPPGLCCVGSGGGAETLKVQPKV